MPIGCLAREEEGRIRLDSVVAAADGSVVIRKSAVGEASEAAQLGLRLADELLDSPARDLLEAARAAAPGNMGAA